MSRRLAALGLAATAWLAADSAHAQAPEDALRIAESLYYEGEVEDALLILDEVLWNEEISDETRIEALKFRAFCLFTQDDRESAKATWLKLLEIDPKFKIDARLASPEFVDFFEDIRPPKAKAKTKTNKTPLPKEEDGETDTQQRQPTQEKERSDDGKVDEKVDEDEPRESKPDILPDSAVQAASDRGCGIALCLIPFGVGQFANDELLKGIVFAGTQLLFITLNISLYWAQPTDQLPSDGHIAMQRASLVLFFTSVALGVADAFVFP